VIIILPTGCKWLELKSWEILFTTGTTKEHSPQNKSNKICTRPSKWKLLMVVERNWKDKIMLLLWEIQHC
jgi:hypothetical protein